jgi:pentalenene synthase/avermitilol synthase
MTTSPSASVQDIGRAILDKALPIWPLSLTSEVNSFVDQAASRTLSWQETFGLTTRTATWKALTRLQPAGLTAHAYPQADLDTLVLASEWIAWFFHIDDIFDESAIGSSSKLARLAAEGLRLAIRDLRVPADESHGVPDVIMDALLDLLLRTRDIMSPVQFRMFIKHVNSYTEALTTEAVNRESNNRPDLESYRTLRRDTGPFFPFIDLVEHASAVRLPNKFYSTAEYASLLDLAADVSGYINDLFSASKEYNRHDCHNLLLVLQEVNEATLSDSIVTLVSIIKECLEEFDIIELRILSQFDSENWNQNSQVAIRGWLAGLRSFLHHSGWYIDHDRYRPADASLKGAS